MCATASSAFAARPLGDSRGPASTLLRGKRASRRALSPRGSKMKPDLSIMPATWSESAGLRHVADQSRQRAADVAEAEQDDLHPLGLDHRAAADARELERGVDPPLALRRPPSPSTTTEMLSSEEPCAIATTLILPAASAEKTPAAMPGVPCMPSPTTAIVAMPGSSSTPSISPRADLRLELALEALARVGRRGLGHAEADRMLRRGLRDERDRDLAAVQRGEGPRGDARNAEHPVAGDGDERLARSRR